MLQSQNFVKFKAIQMVSKIKIVWVLIICWTFYYNHWFKARFIQWKAKDLMNERYVWKFVMWQTSQDFIQINCFSIGKMQTRLVGLGSKTCIKRFDIQMHLWGRGKYFELLFFPMCSRQVPVGSQPMIIFSIYGWCNIG